MRRFQGRSRAWRSRAVLVLSVLAVAGVALIAVPAVSADPAVSQTFVTTYGFFDPCTGEPFSGVGTGHFSLVENVSASGFQTYIDTQIDGLQAVGLVSGEKYVVQDVFHDHFVFKGADEETFEIVAHWIHVGEDGLPMVGDDFYEYMRTHITSNDQGVVTAFRIDANEGSPCN